MKKNANFAGMKMHFKPMLPALLLILLPAFLSAQIKVHPVAEYDFQFRYNTSSKVASPFHGISAGARVNIPTSNYFSFNLGLQYRYAFTNQTVAYYHIQRGMHPSRTTILKPRSPSASGSLSRADGDSSSTSDRQQASICIPH